MRWALYKSSSYSWSYKEGADFSPGVRAAASSADDVVLIGLADLYTRT
jgi:hypothetical protein